MEMQMKMKLKDFIKTFQFRDKEYFILVKRDGKELFMISPFGFEFSFVDETPKEFDNKNPIVCFSKFLLYDVSYFYIDGNRKEIVVEIQKGKNMKLGEVLLNCKVFEQLVKIKLGEITIFPINETKDGIHFTFTVTMKDLSNLLLLNVKYIFVDSKEKALVIELY